MADGKKYILVINSGSATLKFKIFERANYDLAVSGIVEKIGLPGSFINIEFGGKKTGKTYCGSIATHQQALELVFSTLAEWRPKIGVIGHRVVHGGQDFTSPTLITPSVLKRLEKYDQLAPLHNPINIACIRGCRKVLPGLPNVAVFDTAFYKTMPEHVYLYAIPLKFYRNLGIRRYGFHGISHQYVAQMAADKVRRPLDKINLITCHLGSGCSITAVKRGKAIATSMGFTPLEGLMMGTRCGDLDPAVPLYLQSHLKISPASVEEILNKQSGLRGIFGYSNDLRDIMVAAGYRIPGYRPQKKFSALEKKRAKLALSMFVYRIVRYIGSYLAVLGNVDYIIFTAGTGERNADIRNLVMRQVKAFLPHAKPLVIPTNEELSIARQAARLAK